MNIGYFGSGIKYQLNNYFMRKKDEYYISRGVKSPAFLLP